MPLFTNSRFRTRLMIHTHGPIKPTFTAEESNTLYLDRWGFTINNPWDIAMAYDEQGVVGRHGAMPLMTHQLAANTITVTGKLWGNTAYENYAANNWGVSWAQGIKHFLELLICSAQRPDCYLRMGMYDGAEWNWMRKYVVLTGASFPLVPQALGSISSPITLQFRAWDPVWYDDDRKSVSISCSGGSGTSGDVFFLAQAQKPVFRVDCDATCTGAAMQNVKCTEYYSGRWWEVEDLFTTSQRIVINHFDGVCYGGDVTAFTNRMDKFRGAFFRTINGLTKFNITSDMAYDFTYNIYWLLPAFNQWVRQEEYN